MNGTYDPSMLDMATFNPYAPKRTALALAKEERYYRGRPLGVSEYEKFIAQKRADIQNEILQNLEIASQQFELQLAQEKKMIADAIARGPSPRYDPSRPLSKYQQLRESQAFTPKGGMSYEQAAQTIYGKELISKGYGTPQTTEIPSDIEFPNTPEQRIANWRR